MQVLENLSQQASPTYNLENPLSDPNFANLIKQELEPIVKDIDLKGVYPQQFMHKVGKLGGFAQSVPTELGGAAKGLKATTQVIEAISNQCMSTGFIAWCQVACVWYLQKSENKYLHREVLPKVASGEVLAGTGLSNPMKHFANIEKIAIEAKPCDGGYVLNGLLPWVSNIDAGHYFAVVAKIADTEDYMMAIVSEGDFPGLTLRQNAHFIALEGTKTFSCVLRDVFVADQFVLSAPCDQYIPRIKPGFILTQVGMGLGLVNSCIELIQRSNKRLGHVNYFLDDQAEELASELEMLRLRTYTLADRIDAFEGDYDPELDREAIQARITAAELSLKAANSAMLHAGARAYLHGSPQERKLREAYFVAIVTPALKHLKKMLHHMSASTALV
ncbi:Acyl-CoA dehydrogenase type 2 domain protein [Thalassoporum mexicanum PCC 7367]|uniref:acyl-CoA dehydrogenase family protein n=1 Tax=Thalassoporum mexicanum TaxID=3457544 RepID=UPI00029FD878|nr:acyl-CoA dehydrogenase family protein [Pseudanabaena sp. PCC 7367]AFY70018.1 Acyl-CoA dehydrogenase type 2 domain protein [Pseudanabaena sp. PCC 7367]